jgi:oxygen-independent coproporphyrinogen-3 oxidase
VQHQKTRVLNAIKEEIRLKALHHQHPIIETIYIGGGTPSLLNETEINGLFQTIYDNYPVKNDAEVTLEANPDDINEDYLLILKATPVNRFSLGVQSFFDVDLAWMNRAHQGNQAILAIELLKKVGFDNISIDLIYGGPTLSDEHWISNINTAISYHIPHISAYSLTVEPHTALDSLIKKQKLTAPDDAKAEQHFNMLRSRLEEAGFIHYEISNFALPGHEAKHNSRYWETKPYIGIGPSAHSYNGTNRSWNVSNNIKYAESMERGVIPEEIEHLTKYDTFNEYLMTGLRTLKGCDWITIHHLADTTMLNEFNRSLAKLVSSGHIIDTGKSFFINKSFRFLSDGIIADLFVTP